MAEATAKAKEAKAEYDQLYADSTLFRTHWQDVTKYLLPDRSDYVVERPAGGKRMQRVFNGTPIIAHTELASGLHGLMTSPYLTWKYVEAEEDKLNQIDRVNVWFAAVNVAMDRCFAGGPGHFNNAAHEFYLDTTAIGTGCVSMVEDDANDIRFTCHSMKGVVIAESETGTVDTVYRKYKFTAKQACQKWGDAAPSRVKEAYSHRPYEKFHFLHAVKPRRARDPQRADNKNMPVESITYCYDTEEQITEGGFIDHPYAVCRHSKLSDEIYGRSPGMTALPDIKELQEREKTLTKAAQKVVDPPMTYADDAYLMTIKTYPGSLNAHRVGTAPGDQLKAIETHADIPIGVEMVERMEQRIMRQFFVDWLLMPGNMASPESDGKGITATYTTIERDQKMRLLSPMLGRYEDEWLTPVVTGVFNTLWRKSMRLGFNQALGAPFPPPPPELSGKKWKVRYVSPIAVAQRSSSLESIQKLLQIGAGLAQYDPTAAQVFDAEGTIRYAARVMHAPPVLLRSVQALQQLRQQNAQAAAVEHAQGLAKAVKDGTAAVSNLAQARAASVPTPQVAPLGAGGTLFGSRTGVAVPGLAP